MGSLQQPPPRKVAPAAATMGNKNGTPVLREQDIAALSKSSGMDAAQVKEHFAAFLESHPNGKMKPKEFREMVEKTMPKSDASKMEKHVFRIYDSNNDVYSDGTINKKEMQRLIKDMYGLIKADDPEAESKDLMVKSAFAEMDKDADGKITCSEFTTACLSQEKISKMLALKVIDIFVEED